MTIHTIGILTINLGVEKNNQLYQVEVGKLDCDNQKYLIVRIKPWEGKGIFSTAIFGLTYFNANGFFS